MKYWAIAGILFINIVIQSALLPFIQIAGVKPDTLNMLVVSFALLGGSTIGSVTGFAGGLIQDVLYGTTFGINTFQYALIGFLVGLIYDKIFVGRVIFPVFFVFCSTLLRGLMMMVYLFFIRSDISFGYGFTAVILPEAIFTSALMPAVFNLIFLMYQRRFMNKKWRFRRN